MKEERQNEWNKFLNKHVTVYLKNNRKYEGCVKEVTNGGNGMFFIGMTDKFGQFVMFLSSELISLEMIE